MEVAWASALSSRLPADPLPSPQGDMGVEGRVETRLGSHTHPSPRKHERILATQCLQLHNLSRRRLARVSKASYPAHSLSFKRVEPDTRRHVIGTIDDLCESRLHVPLGQGHRVPRRRVQPQRASPSPSRGPSAPEHGSNQSPSSPVARQSTVPRTSASPRAIQSRTHTRRRRAPCAPARR